MTNIIVEKIALNCVKILLKALMNSSEVFKETICKEARNEGINTIIKYWGEKKSSPQTKFEQLLKKELQRIPEEYQPCVEQQIKDIFTEELYIPIEYYNPNNLMNLQRYLVEKYMQFPAVDRDYEGEVKSILWKVAECFIEIRRDGDGILHDLLEAIKNLQKQVNEGKKNYINLSKEVQELQETIVQLRSIIEGYLTRGENDMFPDAQLLVTDFNQLWGKACIEIETVPDENLKDALEKQDALIGFLEQTYKTDKMKELCFAIPRQQSQKALCYTVCVGSNEALPLFYAQALFRRAKICIRRYRKDQNFVDWDKAEFDLEKAKEIVLARNYDECLVAAVLNLPVISGDLYAEICRAEEELNGRNIPYKDLKEEGDRKVILSPFQWMACRENCEFLFEPVFSASFDSVTGKNPEDMEQMELSLFQLAASGKTILLQPPQIIDNSNMLRLIQKNSFRTLCKQGVISCSTFSYGDGTLATPREYLLRNLKNTDFVFSSLAGLRGVNGERNRAILSEALEKNLRFMDFKGRLDETSRIELEEIYDSYRVAFELFHDKTLFRYHQNKKYRIPSRTLTTHGAASLNEVLDRRIEELEEDEQTCHISGRPRHLQEFRKLMESARELGCQNRSEYDRFLNLEHTSSNISREAIELFRSIVHRCYIISNGFRSCDTVYAGETIDELCLHHKGNDSFRDQMKEEITAVDYFFEQYIAPDYTISPKIDWGKIVELVSISRRVFADQNIPASKRCDVLERETGLDGYRPDILEIPILLEQEAETSDGIPYKVSTVELPNAKKITSDVYTN